MTPRLARILSGFEPDLSRFWIVVDPDGLLLNERILATLSDRGFEVLPFDDPLAFRVEYEERYREPWDRGEAGASAALILHLRAADPAELPWDYLRQARLVRLSLAELLPNLDYTVLRQVDSDQLEALYEAHQRFADQVMGENATKDFILTHLYHIDPTLIQQPHDLWRELLRLHYRHIELPASLSARIDYSVRDKPALQGIPITSLFAHRPTALRAMQEGWAAFVTEEIEASKRDASEAAVPYIETWKIPFAHDDIRPIVDSLFLDGVLHPLVVAAVPPNLPD